MEIFDFSGGEQGDWEVTSITPFIGTGIQQFRRLRIAEGTLSSNVSAAWFIKGLRSNMRYTHEAEREQLVQIQAPLGRAEAQCAALIPIKKSEAWWALAQDERRKIFEEQSRHIQIGLQYLPAIARRLYHSRDLGQEFDFLTWFEFSSGHARAFDELLEFLRGTPEWRFVEREVDIRLLKIN